MKWTTTLLAVLLAACNGDLRLGADAGTIACTNGQCPFSLVCASNVCVECNGDGDCKSNGLGRCDLASHRCVQCGASADCGQNAVCEPQTKRCVPSCTMSSMCMMESYRQCDLLRGYCVECATKAQCAEGDRPLCDTRIGQCVECLVDGDCTHDSEKLRCDAITSRCVKCLDNSDCKGESPICNVRDHECGH